MTTQSMLEPVAALLEGAGGSLPITSLNKALFYLDLYSLLHRGETITPATYIALEAGPVVQGYQQRIISAIEEKGWGQQDESEDGMTKPVCLIADPSYRELNAEERAIAHRIGKWAARNSASELSRFSHQNAAWKLLWDRGLGSKRPAKPIDLRIAMQQLIGDDEWLDTLPDPNLEDLLRIADRAMSSSWMRSG